MLNRTNNRLESINQKIKSVVSKNSDLNTFWIDLMQCLNTMNVERDQKAVNVQLKMPVGINMTDTDVDKYAELLTPFAFSHIKEQYELTKKVKLLNFYEENGNHIAQFNSSGKVIKTCQNSCECSFAKVMRLPCRHMLAIRTRLQIPLYDQTCCHIRWTKHFYLSGHRIAMDNLADNSDIHITTSRMKSIAIISGQQKYREAFSIGQKIASCISELGMREYTSVIKQLKSVLEVLQRGKLFSVAEMNSNNGMLDTCIIP